MESGCLKTLRIGELRVTHVVRFLVEEYIQLGSSYFLDLMICDVHVDSHLISLKLIYYFRIGQWFGTFFLKPNGLVPVPIDR